MQCVVCLLNSAWIAEWLRLKENNELFHFLFHVLSYKYIKLHTYKYIYIYINT